MDSTLTGRESSGGDPAGEVRAVQVDEGEGEGVIEAPVWHDRLISLVVLVAVLVLAEVGSRSGIISPLMLPAPSKVWNALVDGFQSGIYWRHLRSTLAATVMGFGLSMTAGFVIGGLLAVFHRLERIFYPFIVALQTLPKIAVAPLIIIWFGFGNLSKVTIVAIVSFFPILVNTLQGLRLRERERFELVRSLGANKWQVFRYIRFPASLPYVFAGLHVGAIFALIGTVVAEFVGARAGLGVLLIQQKALFNVPAVYAVLAILMVVGLSLHGIMLLIERRATFWAQEDRTPVAP